MGASAAHDGRSIQVVDLMGAELGTTVRLRLVLARQGLRNSGLRSHKLPLPLNNRLTASLTSSGG